MGKEAIIEIIRKFRSELEVQSVEVTSLTLYGSYAAGHAKKESDIGLIVVSPDFRGKDYWERTGILANAIYSEFEPIEAVAFTPEEWDSGDAFFKDYVKNGTLIN